MLNSKYSIRQENEIKAVLKQGKTVNSPLFLLKIRPNTLSCSRYLVIISNKASGKAVTRNKKRRQIKYWLKTQEKSLKKGFDVAIICKKPLTLAGFPKIKENLKNLFKKAHLLGQ